MTGLVLELQRDALNSEITVTAYYDINNAIFLSIASIWEM